MSYTVHELFLTAQGEGANLGRTAVFIRFAGCNLWSGREEDRADAVCRFCDTEFRGGEKYGLEALVAAAVALWPIGASDRFCVLTGGEPLLQVDAPLLDALHAAGFTVAIETNGTQPLPGPVDWVCVSPKAGAPLALARADELKLVYPQAGIDPAEFRAFPALHRWLSPMDGPALAGNTAAAAAYCLGHPEWRLNIQAHKAWGIR
ncbi:7-carboxy-7-deazaguanine synthase [Belnapia sp. F-4-1]|uniref:7-carboxy-7-deazaguanine synthase n=1 Tax=Belnapia sp. F-4-1 TaxID=1545443 RepID=UPI0005BDD4E4|nr:7-carboxy-7-deazaguanine synthase [Belnapia sp. F-4-1]